MYVLLRPLLMHAAQSSKDMPRSAVEYSELAGAWWSSEAA